MSTEPPRVTSFSDRQVTQLVQSGWNPAAEPAVWIGAGAWSDCFAFSCESKKYVVRVGLHGDDFAKDHAATVFGSPFLPIPACSRPVSLPDDHYFCVSERVEGIALERVTPWSKVADGFVVLLEALRHVDTTGFSGWGPWDAQMSAPHESWREFLLDIAVDRPGRIQGWRAALDSNAMCAAAFDRGLERLKSTAIDEVPRSLVHNDLFNRNVHVADETITGVFDWGNAMFGDHLYDLANLCFWEPWLEETQPQRVIGGLRAAWAADGYDCINFHQRLQVCMLHNGLAHIAYHASRHDWDQTAAVASRMDAVSALSW